MFGNITSWKESDDDHVNFKCVHGKGDSGMDNQRQLQAWQ